MKARQAILKAIKRLMYAEALYDDQLSKFSMQSRIAGLWEALSHLPKSKVAAVERARRVHAAHASGKSQKAIALDEGISEGRVSQILKSPPP